MVAIQFKRKQFVQNYHLGVKYHQLVADEKKSLTRKIMHFAFKWALPKERAIASSNIQCAALATC